jgi:hypothetical protein
LSRTYYESQKKPIYVARETTISDAELDFQRNLVLRIDEDSESHSGNYANRFQLPAQSRPRRSMMTVSADQPSLVRKVPRNGVA